MMGLRVPPLDELPFVFDGNIPLIKISGLESYWIDETGWAHSRYFVVEPLIQREPDFSRWRPFVKRLNLELMVQQRAQDIMRSQVAEAVRQSTATFAAAALLIM